MRAFILALTLTACSPQIIYVYGDAGPQSDASALVDGAQPDAHESDAALAPEGECLPNRNAGSISSADCYRYASTPVCDAYTARCTAAPAAFCDACETDAQCADGVDLRARCVFMPRHDTLQADQACLSPCDSDADCAFLPRPAWTGVTCAAVGTAGSFCVVRFADSFAEATCSDFMGGRR